MWGGSGILFNKDVIGFWDVLSGSNVGGDFFSVSDILTKGTFQIVAKRIAECHSTSPEWHSAIRKGQYQSRSQKPVPIPVPLRMLPAAMMPMIYNTMDTMVKMPLILK